MMNLRLFLLLLLVFGHQANAQRGWQTNILADTFGYEAADLDVPIDEVMQGCGQRDCIPAIDQPRFISADQATYLGDKDIVLGVIINGVARAYPSKVLDRHEIVNDIVGGQPIAVTYCPLCGSGLAFSRVIDGQTTTLGVSGLLRNSDLIVYDRASNSLWQQITGKAFAGPKRGTQLAEVPLSMATWADWISAHPASQVLEPPGSSSAYRSYPYGDYRNSRKLLFDVPRQDKRLHPKRVVYGFEIGDESIAFEQGWLSKNQPHSQEINGTKYSIKLQPDGHVVASDAAGSIIHGHRLFWFAWYSFHPDTLLRH